MQIREMSVECLANSGSPEAECGRSLEKLHSLPISITVTIPDVQTDLQTGLWRISKGARRKMVFQNPYLKSAVSCRKAKYCTRTGLDGISV